jgi:peroxiredoxin Q/BCP
MQWTPGQQVPDFSGLSDDGQSIHLRDLADSWVVLYFYPKASSPGCSIEAKQFEDLLPAFGALGAKVLGVSTDTEAAQAHFRQRCALSFPLLPDSDRSIARSFGVLRGLGGWLGMAARQTFLIAPGNRLARHWPLVNPNRHAQEVLQALKEQLDRQPDGPERVR